MIDAKEDEKELMEETEREATLTKQWLLKIMGQGKPFPSLETDCRREISEQVIEEVHFRPRNVFASLHTR